MLTVIMCGNGFIYPHLPYIFIYVDCESCVGMGLYTHTSPTSLYMLTVICVGMGLYTHTSPTSLYMLTVNMCRNGFIYPHLPYIFIYVDCEHIDCERCSGNGFIYPHLHIFIYVDCEYVWEWVYIPTPPLHLYIC